jgi:hypothetical protein
MRYKYLILGRYVVAVDYQIFLKHQQIIDALAEVTPVIVFGKDVGFFK